MNIIDAMKARRSIRKFRQEPIPSGVLTNLIDCARLAPYPANIQPLKFAVVSQSELLNNLFDCTKWAGYLKNGAPQKGEGPVAYIVILGDKDIKGGNDFKSETGIAGSHITLAAMEYGIASCWIGSLNRDKIADLLKLPENLSVQDVIALGYPMQKSIAVDITDGIKYYLTEDKILHVPKRSINDVLYKLPSNN